MFSKKLTAVALTLACFVQLPHTANAEGNEMTTPTRPVYVIGRLHFGALARPIAELFAHLARGLPAETKQEEGCLEYRFYRSKSNQLDFVSVEKWASAELFDRHMKTLKMRAFVVGMSPFMTASPEITVNDPLLGNADGKTDDDALNSSVVVIRRFKAKPGAELDAKLAEIQTTLRPQALQFNVFKSLGLYPNTQIPEQYSTLEFWRSLEDVTVVERAQTFNAAKEQSDPRTEADIYAAISAD